LLVLHLLQQVKVPCSLHLFIFCALDLYIDSSRLGLGPVFLAFLAPLSTSGLGHLVHRIKMVQLWV
jgi:hypothetical protein